MDSPASALRMTVALLRERIPPLAEAETLYAQAAGDLAAALREVADAFDRLPETTGEGPAALNTAMTADMLRRSAEETERRAEEMAAHARQAGDLRRAVEMLMPPTAG